VCSGALDDSTSAGRACRSISGTVVEARDGDASQLLLQAAALLIFLSVLFLLPENYFRGDLHPQARLTLAWSSERFLIATRMLVVGLFAILSWDNLSVANCRSWRTGA
jgi:hypothetical protein